MLENINERIKKTRKQLKLSQDEFGKRLGVSRGVITNIEFNKTEPKSLFIDLLCREFNVNENWLRTGEGKMFVQLTENAQFDLVCQELKFSGKHEVIKQILMVYWDLPDDKKDIVDKLVEDIAEKIVKGKQQKKPE